ncbi:MAG TPA: 4Fe-4S dicluster domain-containing protein [Caulobacteraceae bacterium]|jgi:molybdopterin-containing oxidoreductase family iron-sulfur binding subunit|nr:4Fe-4S dicluster domain-containing protein [Caulobacteraceae bacterium]
MTATFAITRSAGRGVGRRAGLDRRQALQLLAAGAAAALASCGPPREQILPYAKAAEGEELTPGAVRRYATTLTLAGYGRGVVGRVVDGRPIKLEGNPAHPASLGGSDVFTEAAILDLYDPWRAQAAAGPAGVAAWSDFAEALGARLAGHEADHGAGLRLVTGRITGPSQLRLIKAIQARFPAMVWVRYEPLHDDAERQGTRLAYGRSLTPLPRFADADVILCLGADPLGPGPAQVAQARALIGRRRGGASMSRLYVAEPSLTLTGVAADHRRAAGPLVTRAIALELARRLGAPAQPGEASAETLAFAGAVADDLIAHKGRALVLVGPGQSAQMHALAAWTNHALAAPVDVIEPIDPHPDDHADSLARLDRDLAEGAVTSLIVLGANPVHDAPDGAVMARAIGRLPFSAALGLYDDETAGACRWRAPLSHALETWSDAVSPDGTASLAQPLIRPLYDSRGAEQALALMAGQPASDARDLVRATWQAGAAGDFEAEWRQALVAGVLTRGGAAKAAAPAPRWVDLAPIARSPLILSLTPSASLWDGRYAANAWLQECPDPLTKEVWGRSLRLAPGDARTFGIAEGDRVRLSLGDRSCEAVAAIVASQAPGIATLPLGGGRTRAGPIGSGLGGNPAPLRGRDLRFSLEDMRLERLGPGKDPPVTQNANRLDGDTGQLLPTMTLAALAAHAKPADDEAPPSLLTTPPRGEHAWAMVIDAAACIGCNACIVACQAENNIPVIGPEEIAVGRDMHWLRVDRYDQGPATAPDAGFLPIPCMQCEHAPCEPVCPVEASVHDGEGLNDQVYNRCVGTRFCQANCPYKVRRFNYRDYAAGAPWGDLDVTALKAQRNPEVSVRGRGVMEKCTYCVQRIAAGRAESARTGQPIADGAVKTACQVACPTEAISFGDLQDGGAQVAALRRDPRHYVLLNELGTRPRTTYLARVRNPNPALGSQA